MDERLTIDAEPEPIELDLFKSAIIVVDMQNAFVKNGGYLDLTGHDISATQKIIPPCRKIITAFRSRGVKIIYFQMGYSPDLSDKGALDSPGTLKSRVLNFINRHPEFKDKVYIYGTWGAEIIDELKPETGDITIKKQRYDGFFGTNLDLILKTVGIKYLFFIGTATNICVESTIRHAFFLDYFPVLISDAVSHMGPGITQEATILNVRSTFGWVTTSNSVLNAIDHIQKVPSMRDL
jgi:ureidoacrylate peracid hydrolase